MSIEEIPIVVGVLVFLLGAAVAWDAWGPQTLGPMRERRRRIRADIDVRGELVAGIGVALLGVALMGRTWRFETITVIVGALCLVIGALRNRKYFREVFLFRGSARRDTAIKPPKSDKMRIR